MKVFGADGFGPARHGSGDLRTRTPVTLRDTSFEVRSRRLWNTERQAWEWHDTYGSLHRRIMIPYERGGSVYLILSQSRGLFSRPGNEIKRRLEDRVVVE
jgi:hypothetical protein